MLTNDDRGRGGACSPRSGRGRGTPITLEALLGPVTAEEFFERHFERAPLLVRRGDPDFYGELFSLGDVDAYLQTVSRSTEPEITVIPPADSGEGASRHRPARLHPAELYDAMHAGRTIRFDAMERSWPPLARLAAAGRALGGHLRVNMYLTPAASRGFGIHYDPHDAFVLQVHGAKDWWVWEPEPADALPIERTPYLLDRQARDGGRVEDPGEPALETRVEPGDLLYIPRGFPHRAATPDGPTSVHLTAALQSRYRVDLLAEAVQRLAIDDVELRRALTGRVMDPAVPAAEVADAVGDLFRDAIDRIDLEAAVESVRGRYLAEQPLPPDGQFAAIERLDTIEPDTLLRRRPGVECRVAPNGDRASVSFGGREVAGPGSIGRALAFIRDSDRAFRVRELPGDFSDRSRVVLARRLVRAGLLRPVE